ncbi:SNF2-related protein [Pseudodesulfovibrio tunisiensis]|uniref:MuF-C-terminal domain-containing protein n=1 Tax=Pseudodesulfovibrio tunisiensis TaxID=463192 RepID=UPI001FB52F37|nr:SNF2-related protein [Pseudodesulfovibrio tunisiensis]
MASYVGWGGLKSVFDPKKAESSDLYGRAQRELKKLLSEDEYRDAYASVRNAHYTARGVVDAMWRMFRLMGFKGGRALEPSVGIGNFLGLQPRDMAAATEWHAAELDTITGQLAAMVYPEANIMVGTGFQDAPFADGVFDIAIGNPPFGSNVVRDGSEHRKHLSGMKIHNYIIAKTGMHLRPGGVMGMVVTHRFLDTANPEARNVLAKDFKFLGAVRLPNDAFKANAGTDVVTDIILLQKLRADEKPEPGAAWLDTSGQLEDGIRVNRYFAENSGHILGKSAMDGSMYARGAEEYTVHGDGRDVGKAIDEILAGSLSGLSGILDRTAADMDLAPAMLEQSDIPIGGMMLDDEGRILRREMDDESGNAVVTEVTPETPWSDQAAEWESLADAAEEIRTRAQQGDVPEAILAEFNEAAQVAYNQGMKEKPKPTRAEASVYRIRNAVEAQGSRLKWDYEDDLEQVRRNYSRKKLGTRGHAALKGLLDLRNRTQRLIQEELADGPNIEKFRQNLNRAYDAFVEKHGFVSAPGNFRLLGGDIGAEAGLESSYEAAISSSVSKKTGDKPRKAHATKSDILNQRVNYPRKEITSAANSSDALRVSMVEHGKVDLPYMAKLTGQDINAVIDDLTTGENPELFFNPETEAFEDAESYLSGNVKRKLDRAMEGDSTRDMAPNIKALKVAMPAPKTREQIRPNIRGFWIPKQIFKDFLEALGAQNASLSLLESQGRMVAKMQGQSLTDLGLTFRHPDTNLVKLFNAAAAGKSLTIMRRDGETSYKDEKATKEVNALVNRMAKIFEDWAYSDEGRVEMIVEAFNEKMNTHSPRKYDGEKYFRPSGMTPAIQLRRTQKNAAWRMVQDQNVLLDHVVGAGKTFTAIAGIMERRRIGFSRKPMIVVPNHLVTQWAQDFYKLYPGAKVLAATPADFAKKHRRRLFARIATGDFDAVIIGHSSLGFIEAPTEDVEIIVTEKMDALREVLEEARRTGESKRTLTQIQNRIDSYEDKLKELKERPRDEMGINFKDMGVDYLVVDEAHEFKNLEYATAGERVVGMNDPNGSKKAFDLYIKVRGVQKRGGGVVFATGTPVSNSLVEIYTIMNYLAHDELAARNQLQFDSWSGAYAATETRLEYTATQKLKERRVLSGLNNLSALKQIYEHFADVISLKDLKRIYAEEVRERNRKHGTHERAEFPLPKVKGGGRQLDTGDITPAQREFMDYLVARMAAIEANKSDRDYASIDNALWVLSDARKMSLDIRTVDHAAPRDEGGKVARAAERISETYSKWDAQRGTQLVFCDLSTPSKQAAKNAKKTLRDVAHLVMDRKRAASFLRSLGSMPYSDQWTTLYERVEALVSDPQARDDMRDKVEAFFAANSPEDILTTMAVADTGFSVYDDLKAALVERGIPETEIEFIHDHNTPQQKDKLFGRMNNGYVRVLIGSSAKMGAGTNAQRRLVALHHMDAPWRPSDVEQREGRIIRQGNMFYEQDPDGFQVEITAYSTSQTSDTVMWQILERKAGAIEQFRSGDIDSVQEESSDSDQYAEFMATSTGNPVFRQKLEAERKLDEISAEIDGALMSRQNAKAFLDRFDANSKRLQKRAREFGNVSVSRIRYGREGGSVEEYAQAMDALTRQFNREWAAHQLALEEYKKAFAGWENAPEKTRGKPPVAPKPPVKPHLMSREMQARSGYARAVGKALGKAGYGKTVSLDLGEAALEISGDMKDRDGRIRFLVELVTKGGERLRLEAVRAKEAVNSSNLASVFSPTTLSRLVEWEGSAAQTSLKKLKKAKPRNEELARIEVDTSERDALREEVQWLAKQVAFAEAEADIERGSRPNKFIEQDRTRSLSRSSRAALEESETIVAEDGEAYRTTGLVAGSARQAVRERDGMPAVLLERRQDDGKVFQAMVQPESLREEGVSKPDTARDAAFSFASKRTRGMPRKLLLATLQRLQSKARNALPLEVVQSFEDLPESIKAQAREKGSGYIEAANDREKVYLVAENIGSVRRAVALWMHEQGVHTGLRELFSPLEYRRMLNLVYVAAGGRPTFRLIAKQYGFDLNSRIDQRRAAEEYLAHLAEKVKADHALEGREISAWRRFVKAVAEWLRRHGVNLRLTGSEVAWIVNESIRATIHGRSRENGETVEGMEPAVSFAQRDAKERQTQAQVTKQVQSDVEQWESQLDDFQAGKLHPRRILTVGQTPDVLRKLGASNVPVVMSQHVLRKARNKHDIPLEVLHLLPLHLADPILVLESATMANSLVVMTEMEHAGEHLAVPVHLDVQGGKAVVNEIASIHDRSVERDGRKVSGWNWVVGQARQGRLKYLNEKKILRGQTHVQAAIAWGLPTPEWKQNNSRKRYCQAGFRNGSVLPRRTQSP